MGFAAERTAIEAKFASWTTTSVKWPNLPFQQPSSAWIAVHIVNGSSSEISVAPPILRRHLGVVIVQIFDKENNSEATIRTLADQVEALFLNQPQNEIRISATETVRFWAPSLGAAQTVNGWQQRNVTIPFERDEMK